MRLCFGKSPENLWFPRPAGAFTWNISVRHMQACTSVFIPCSLLPSRTLYHIFFISTLYISVILPQLSHLYLHAKMLTYQHLCAIIRNIDLSTSLKFFFNSAIISLISCLLLPIFSAATIQAQLSGHNPVYLINLIIASSST